MQERRDERPLGQLFADLGRQLTNLIRDEIALARTEMTMKVTSVGRDVVMAAAGGALIYAALLALMVAAAILLVEAGLDAWLAFAVVGIVVGVIGAVIVMRARDRLAKTDVVPRRTMETIEEDADWAKEQVT
jgi:uncharacterized protein YacL